MQPLPVITLAAVALASSACASPGAGPPPPFDPSDTASDPPRAAAVEDSEAVNAIATPPATAAPAFVRKGPGARLLAPPPPPPGPLDGQEPEFAPQGNWKKEVFPGNGLLYDTYLAAQRQSRSSLKIIYPTGGDDNHKKVEGTIGFDIPVVRWTNLADPSVATELQFELAVFSRFDRKERWDMDATDWRFGIPLAHRDGDLAWKIHLYHMSSHLGDEYMVRTGATPIDYHLNEAAFGLSWDATEGQRLYGEAGIAVYTSGPADNGRLQAGWEWVGSKASTGLAPFMAIDIESRHYTNWIPGKTAAVGVAYGRYVRMSVEYYHGYDTQTQFAKQQQQYLALGLAMEF